MTRQGYVALSLVGLLVAVAGGAMIAWYGSAGGAAPEDWLGRANVGDVIGGLM